MKEAKKIITLWIILALITSSASAMISADMTVAAQTDKSTQSSKKANKKALQAYGKLLSTKKYKYNQNGCKFKFGLVDINKDGISELVIHSDGNTMAGYWAEIWFYHNGKVSSRKYFRTYPLIYSDGMVYYYMGHMSDLDYTYEKIKNGKLKIVCGYESTDKNTILLHGKKVSRKKFEQWAEEYDKQAKEVKIKYYKNTAANRKQYLGQAGSKSKTVKTIEYTEAMARVLSFRKKDGKLLAKLEKGIAYSIVDSNSQSTKNKLNLKLAKNCKWVEKQADNGGADHTGSEHKSSYTKIKKIWTEQRKLSKDEYYWESSPFRFIFTVKGKKITKVAYLHS